jgi:hypothetical protein
MIPLAVLEGVIDASGAAPRIEALLPSGARPRQLAARTLLLGMMITLADGRPAHLTPSTRRSPRCPRTTSGGSASSPAGRTARTG